MSTDAFDSLYGKSAPSSAGGSLDSLYGAARESAPGAKKPSKPKALLSALDPEKRAIAGTGSKVLDLLSRSDRAVESAVAGGNAGGTLAHGNTAAQQGADRAAIRHKMGLDDPSSLLGRSGTYDSAPQWERGLVDFGIDTALDPTTYAGGLGLLKRGAMGAAEHALPMTLKAAGVFGKAAEKLGPEAKRATDWLGGLARDTYDRVTYGGELKRDLAGSQSPKQAAISFARAAAAKGGAEGEKDALGEALSSRFHDIVDGLSKSDEHALYVALNNGTLYRLPKALRAKAADFKQLTDTAAHLLGTRNLKAQLASQGFKLPDWAKQFDQAGRAIMQPRNYRQAYLPLVHDGTVQGDWLDALNAKYGPQRVERATLNADDPFLRERNTGMVSGDNELQRAVIDRRFKAAANAFAAKGAQKRASQIFGTQKFNQVPIEARRFIENESSIDRGKVLGALYNLVDLPKQALFMLPGRHMGNISFLQALHYPEALPDTVRNFAATARGASTPSVDAARATGLAGAASVDRNSRFADILSKTPLALRIGAGATAGGLGGYESDGPEGGILGALLGGVAGGKAPDLYRTSSRLLWAYDDAAKAAALKSAMPKYVRSGMSQSEARDVAAKEVGDRLVRYDQRSDFTKAAGGFAPFATWRTKLPGAIGRALIEHPERVNMASRAFPASTGSLVDPGNMTDEKGRKLGVGSYNPLTDTLKLADDPNSYARATLSFPIQSLLSQLGVGDRDAFSGKKRYDNFMSYGKKPWQYFLSGLLSPVPGANEAMSAVHMNPFADSDFLMDLLGGQTGLRLQRAP